MTRDRLLAAWQRLLTAVVAAAVLGAIVLVAVAWLGFAIRVLWHAFEWGLGGLPL